MRAPTLYVIATPISNLKDITLRALETLHNADAILCEDTRVTRKLLARYNIVRPLVSYHQHSPERTYQKLAALLGAGKQLALVTDAGTPGIADPGGKLIHYIRRAAPAVNIVPIPGPSALTAALSVAGITQNQFCFLGWAPHKKGRKTFFEHLAAINMPAVFYESPHRICKTLDELERVLQKDEEIVLLRELTKIHEEVLRGSAGEVKKMLTAEKQRGEFVVVLPKMSASSQKPKRHKNTESKNPSYFRSVTI